MQEYTPSGNVNFYGVWDETAGTMFSLEKLITKKQKNEK